MAISADIHPLDLRLAPEFRRSALYVAAGLAVGLGLTVWMHLAGIVPLSWGGIAAFGGVGASGAASLLGVTFRYRLQIDARGVWRRRLVRWDLWPWEAFESGRIRHGQYGDQFSYPEKAWYWRTISTSLLGKADRAAFELLVARFWVPPPPPELPGAVVVKYGFWARLELSAEGVRRMAHRNDPGELIPWQEVVKAEVIRESHDRPDFVVLTLHLPGMMGPVRLAKRRGQPTWSGADAEVIALYLRRHLGESQFEVAALRGPPVDTAEADRRLVRLDNTEQQSRKLDRLCLWIYVVGTLLMTAIGSAAWNRPNPLNWGWQDWVDVGLKFSIFAVVLGLQVGMYFGMAYFQRRDLRRERDEVLRWRADHSGPT